jgi:hypothetical protein
LHPLPETVAIELGLDEPDDPEALKARVARAVGVAPEALPEPLLLKRSLDARRGRVRFRLLLSLTGERVQPVGPEPREVSQDFGIVIVGDGPAGLFCAYELARQGIGCTVIDRGKLVQPRRHDLKALNRRGEVNPDSNYCFGEGGAGTYSDGKLYTRSHKRGSVRDVLEILAAHGAPPAILSDARPHIGSNLLPKVVSALRVELEALGVKFDFGARMLELVTTGHGQDRAVAGIRLADGRELAARAVVLATGHSARDVFEICRRNGVRLEAKPFALGVRIEHPQPLIDRIQYGAAAGHARLPAASYRLAAEVEERGVFSFCMCPGGFVVPASTEPDGLVVNGMSLSKRNSRYANSGLVVAIELEDLARAGLSGPLGGVELQRRIEQVAFLAGGGALKAPATRATDFVARRASSNVPSSSYIPGLVAADVAEVLDSAGVSLAVRLRNALLRFDAALGGYLSEEAVLIGVESRTSTPVRIVRDETSLCSPDLKGLYPAGEGAGYAGGIMSAALDGMRIARELVRASGVELIRETHAELPR